MVPDNLEWDVEPTEYGTLAWSFIRLREWAHQKPLFCIAQVRRCAEHKKSGVDPSSGS